MINSINASRHNSCSFTSVYRVSVGKNNGYNAIKEFCAARGYRCTQLPENMQFAIVATVEDCKKLTSTVKDLYLSPGLNNALTIAKNELTPSKIIKENFFSHLFRKNFGHDLPFNTTTLKQIIIKEETKFNKKKNAPNTLKLVHVA